LQVRLRDRFGDNGMISVVICRDHECAWLIDTWLMSCRVLGRKVENAVLNEIALQAQRRRIGRLLGRSYRPTGRNSLVEDHYERLGFRLVETCEDGSTLWQLDLSAWCDSRIPMQVHRSGFATPLR
jgi:FkbH-like protein